MTDRPAQAMPEPETAVPVPSRSPVAREIHELALQVATLSARLGQIPEAIDHLSSRVTTLEHTAERRAGTAAALGKVATTSAVLGTIAGTVIGSAIGA